MDVEKVSGRCGKTSSQLKSKSIIRSKRRENKRSREELFDDQFEKTAALKKKNQLRERVKLELDRAAERGFKSVARPMAPDSYTKMAATEAISAAAEAMTKKLRIN